MTLKLFVLIQSCYMPKHAVLGSMIPELQDMRVVCLLKAFTPRWVANSVSFTFVFDDVLYYGSFEVLQAKVKFFSAGPGRPSPRALNRQYSARNEPINASFMKIT